MATKAGDITFGVGFQVDKTGLQQVQQQLQQLQSGLKTTDIMKINNSSLQEAIQQLTKIQSTAQDVQNAMTKAFNPKIGSLNLSKFQSELKTAGHSIESIYKDFNMAGTAGQAAFRGVATQTLTANVQLKEHNKLLLDMGKTLANSFKYSVSYGVLNNLTGAIQSAFQYSKSLDSSLNDIRIVTDKSANDMERFAESANKAAKELGASTIDYTKASLIYYQQGLADEDVEARTDVTLKAANVTGQSTAEVSEQLTAVWNGYKVSAEEAELYVDKLAAVAATTASDLEELSTGMSKVASAANAMGVDIDQLNGMLSTIVSVTRQAPESAGTALKTIFARMGDLELNGEDEFGVSLGKVSSALDSVGVKILDINGEIRDMGEVIEEVGNKWNTGAWTNAEKQALAIALAGKRQYNNLLALFDNWDMYNKAVETSMSSQGTLQKQQDIYMESTAAHIQKMQTAWEDVKDSLLKPKDINPIIDASEKVATTFETAIDTVGGLRGILAALGTVALQVFSSSLGKSVSGFVDNLRIAKNEATTFKLEFQALEALKNTGAYTGINGQQDDAIKYTIEQSERLRSIYNFLDSETVNRSKALLRETSEAQNLVATYKDMAQATAEAVNIGINTSLSQGDIFGGVGVEKIAEARSRFEELTERVNDTKTQLRELDLEIQKVGDNNATEEQKKKQEELKQSILETTETILAMVDKMETFGEGNDNLVYAKENLTRIQEAGVEANIAIEDMISDLGVIGGEASRLTEVINAWQKIADKTKEAEQQAALYVESFEQHVASLNVQAITTAVTTSIGSLGQLAMATQSITNAIDQAKNDQADFANILISSTMGISMFISALNNLGKVFGITTALQNALTLSQEVRLAKGKAEIAQTVLQTTIETKQHDEAVIGIGKEIAAEKIKKKITEEAKIQEMAVLACKKAGIVASEKNLSVIAAEIAATEAENKVKEKQIALQAALNALKAAAPFALLAVAIGAAIGGLIAYNQHIEKQIQLQQDANRETIEAAKQKLNETNANKELVSQYNSLYSTYKKTGDVKDELNSSTEELIDKYDIENGKLLLLQENYDVLTKKIREKRKAELSEELQSANTMIDSSIDSVKAQVSKAGAREDFGRLSITSEGISDEEDRLTQLQQAFGKGYYKTQKLAPGHYDYIFTFDWNDPDHLAEQLKKVQEFKSKLEENNETNTWSYNFITDLLEDEDVEAAIASLEEGLKSAKDIRLEMFDIETGLSDSTTFEDFVKRAKSFKDATKDIFSEEDVNNYISNLNSQFSDLYEMYESQREQLNEVAQEYLDDLPEADLQIAVTMTVDKTTSGQEIDKYIDYVKRQKQYSLTYDVSDTVSNLSSALMDNKITSKEQKSINEQIASLRDSGYGSLMEGFETKTLTEQLTILQAISDMQNEIIEERFDMNEADAEYSARLKAESELIEKKKAAEEKLVMLEKELEEINSSNGGLDKANATLGLIRQCKDEIASIEEQIQNGDYEIEVEIKPVTEQDFVNQLSNRTETLVNDIGNAANAVELIGENWLVAAENVEQLSKLMPDLFDEAQVNADGTLQLTKEQTQTILDGKQAEIEANKEVLIADIEAQKAILVNKKEQLEAQLGIAEKLASGEISLDEAKTEATTQNLYGYSDFLETSYEDWLKGDEQVNSEIATGTTSLVDSMVTDINRVTEAWNEAWKAERGEGGVQKDTSGVSTYKSISTDVTFTNNREEFAKKNKEAAEKAFGEILTKSLQQQLKATDQQIAALDADVSAINATASKAIGAMDRVRSGKAGKTDKSKSSSKESEDKKQLLKLEDEIDLYREVNEQLEEVDHNLKMLQKQEDRTYGAQHIENLKAQSAELAKQQKLIEKKLSLTKQDLAMRQKLLSTQGVQFGADGDISNYQALLTEKINNINALYTQYNNTLDKALKSTIKTQADNAKEEYESLKKSIEAYEKLQDQMDQLNEQWQDARNAEIDKQIEAFNYRIDIDLNVAKATKRWNEFKRKVVDDMENIADPVKKVIEQMKAGIEDYRTTYSAGGEVAINTGAVRETLDQFNQMMDTGTASIYGNNPAQLVADLEKRKEDLMKSVEDAEQIITDMRKMYLDSLDDAYDKMEKHTEQYEYISNLIEHDINLIELLRGEEAYEDMGRYYDRQAQNNIKNVEFLRMQRDALREQVDSLEKDSKAWKKVYQQLQDTEMELRDSVNESVQLLLDRYENGLNKILKDLDKKVSGGMGVDYLQEQYEMQQDLADNYLDSVNQAYALEKLRAKFTKAINDTTDIKAREKLTNLLHEQVDALAEKEKLAQYEVDHAEKMLEVEQARIALEEAQANKSQMRLKRDNQGNYSYQYVADEDAIDDAQQDLLDAENDLWNFDVGGLRTAREEAIKIWQEYFEKLREIWEDTSLTEEERQQKLLDLDNWRTGELEANVEKYNFFKTNTEQDANTILADLYSQNADEFGRVVMEEILPDWNSGVDSMIEKYAGEGIPACQEALAQLQANTEEYRTKVDELAEAAGMDFDEICNGIDMTIDYTYSLMNTNEEMINQYRREMDELNELNRILEDVQREFQAARDEAIRMAQEATNAIQKANELRAASEAAKAAADAAAASASQSSYYSGGGSGGGSGSGSGGGQTSSGGSSSSDTGRNYKVVGYDERGISITIYDKTLREAQEIMEQYNRRGGKTRVAHYDTGGYTGDWHSSEGKVAMLHEKEIVLNKHDTENMLDAVNVVRHIVASLDGSMLGRLADMSALAFNSITPGIETSNETLEQNVHIEASFPNATNRNEIEEAFNNLVNIASQKALNTRR